MSVRGNAAIVGIGELKPALRRIKAHGPLRDIPVVVFTGSADEEMLRLCVGLGTSMYLVKPMTVASAMNVILGAEKRWRALDPL